MGYIEDLRDAYLEDFSSQLKEAKENNPDEFLFQMDFSIVCFSCGLIEGYKTIRELDRLINIIKKRKHQMTARINEKCSNLDLGTDQWNSLPKEEKSKLKKEIRRILLELTNEDTERIKQLKKIKFDIVLHIGKCFLYVLSVLLTVGFGALLYLNNVVVSVIVYPISIIALLCFIAIQVLYTVKYLKAIKSTIRGIIDFSLKRFISTLLIVWWYFAVLTFVNGWDTGYITYSFSAIFILNIIHVIFDLFLSSTFFDEYESALSLLAAIIIGFVLFADSFNHPLVSQVGSIFQLIACLLLSMLIVKKFLIDKQSIKTLWGMMYIIFIAFLTIMLTIFAFYKLFWMTPQEGQVVDNTLFSAVVGVYSAILGGGLTLAGVAWTIKKNEEDKNHERALLEKDRQTEERKKFMPYLKHATAIPENSSMVQSYEWTVNRSNIEIDDERVVNNDNKLFGIGINSFFVKNISTNNVILVGVRVNGELFKLVGDLVVESKEYIYFNLKTSFAIDSLKPIKSLQIICSDILGNIYSFDCEIIICSQYSEERKKGDKFLIVPCLLYDITGIGLPRLEISDKL